MHNQRFFSYLSLFTFMMIVLVTANNFLLMFVGWEGVGVCSYLLVSFWFTRIAANQSSMSAFLTNRVGDCFLTLGMFAMIWTFGNLDYPTVFALAPYINGNIVTTIGICLLIGAMAKSSQIGLHVWLPLAMEGPTPVSALIHAATMVTAGVYLLMRTSPLIEYSSTVLILCLWIGSITTVFSSLIGLFQQDIKKVIAYSTMSQLAREYLLFRHQTICVEVIFFYIFISFIDVIRKDRKKFKLNNSQITKAHDHVCNHISDNFYNSFILPITMASIKWKVIIISKLVGISEAIRLILVYIKLYCINLTSKFLVISFFTLSFVKSSTRNLSCNYDDAENYSLENKARNKELLKFNEWLAGLIDGDGYFILTKKGYTSLEITMDIRDKKALYEIKHKYGGSVKPVSNANSLRYKLRHKKGLIDLINGVNGLIRNPIRMLQMNKLCVRYNIELKQPLPLTYYNGWLSGFIDSDGSIYFNESSGQVFISVSQKNRFILEPLISIYGGKIYIVSPKIEAFKYVIYRKKELFDLIENYFNKYPLKSKKSSRKNLIKQYYDLWVYKDGNNINKYNDWISFIDKWDKYKH